MTTLQRLRRPVLLLAVVGAFALLRGSRLGPAEPLDGDESILGLMALHWCRDGEFPSWFWGQRFGLSTLESGVVALAFQWIGISSRAARVGIAILFAVGLWGFLLLARERTRQNVGPRDCNSSRVGIVAACLLGLSPAWDFLFASPRGYLVGGFAMSSWLAVWATRSRSVAGTGALGAAWMLLAASHAGFALAVLPFVLRGGVNHRWIARGRWTALGTGALIAGSLWWWFAQHSGKASWTADYLQASPNDLLHAALELPRRTWTMLTGRYSLGWPAESSVGSSAVAAVTLSLFGAAMCARLPRGSDASKLRRDALWAMCCVAAITLPMREARFGYRHLLPMVGPLCLVVVSGTYALRIGGRRHTLHLIAMAAIVGGMTQWGRPLFVADDPILRPTSLGRAESLDRLAETLQRAGVGHVYSLDPWLPWTLMFASEETLLARWTAREDRRPQVIRAVDRALFEDRPTALVGTARDWWKIAPFLPHLPTPLQLDSDRYFCELGPDRPLLEALGFEFTAR